MKSVLIALTVVSSVAVAQPGPPPMPPMPPPGFFSGPPGIPPPVAARLGVPPETVKKIQQLGFDANEALINLESDLKRAQLELDRALAQREPDEAATLAKLDAITRAELQVRKNRMSLMLKIRKLLGPQLWERLQAELPMMGEGGPGPGPGPGRREPRFSR